MSGVATLGPRPMRHFIVRLLAVGMLLHAYVAFRLLPDLPGRALWGWLGLAALAASWVLIARAFLRQRSRTGRAADALSWAGFLALGAFSSLLVLTAARDAALLLAWLARLAAGAGPLPGPWLENSAAAVVAGAALASLAGLYGARRRAPVRRVDVALAGLPAAFEGFTIAQVSDLHVGPTIKRGYAQAVVDAVNRLGADVVALTGDLVDGTVAGLAPHVEPLSRLRARHGVYAVTGNHEYYSGAAEWVAEFRRLGMQVLLNRHEVIRRGEAALVLAGVTDYGAEAFDPRQRSDPAAALAGAPADAAVRILLAHQPRSARAAAPAGYHLQLSGHTHGGQFLPWNFLVRMQQPFTAGLHRLGGLQVYVSRGTGYWGPPKRLGAPSEITLLRLTAAR